MRIHGRSWPATLALSITALIGPFAATAHAEVAVGGVTFTYASFLSTGPDECLDVPDGSTANGEYIQQWQCNGDAQQQWIRVQTVPTSGGYMSTEIPFLLENVDTGKCASILNNSNSAGAAVIQWPCVFSGNDNYELWWVDPTEVVDYNNGEQYFYVYVNFGISNATGQGYFIHADGGSLANGAHLFVNNNGNIDNYLYAMPPEVI